MTPRGGGSGRRLALMLVALATPLVPRHLRADWRREWQAEIRVRAAEGGAVVLPGAGAIRHALWLRGAALQRAGEQTLRELRFAARGLVRRPLFALGVTATLALGIGATSAVFSVVDAVLVAPLPYPGGDRLVEVTSEYVPWEMAGLPLNATLLEAWRARAASIEAMEAYNVGQDHLAGEGPPMVAHNARVTAGFLTDLLAVQPLRGRTFAPEENEPGQGGVAIVSEDLWRTRWGGDPSVLGRTIRLDGAPHEIVGIMPRVALLPEVDVWTPMELRPGDAAEIFGSMNTVARPRAGVSLDEVAADLLRASELAAEEAGAMAEPWRAGVGDFRETVVGDIRTDLWILMAAVLAVLLIACVNVANLLLTRGADRRHELHVRSSLGASRGDLLRTVVVEAFVLALAGGAAGVALAAVVVRVLLGSMPEEIPLAAAVAVDGRVLLFALALTGTTALVLGLVPALGAGRLSRQGMRPRGASLRRGERRGGKWLLGAEVAQASALLVAAMLMLSTLQRMSRADSGFRPEGLAFVHLELPPHAYPEAEARTRFLQDLRPQLRAVPGVRALGVGSATPFSGMTFLVGMQQEGGPRTGASDGGINFATADERIAFSQVWADPDYLSTLGLPIVQGRPLRPDDAEGPSVALINETAARAFWPGESPIGRRVRVSNDDPWTTIVGVVRDFSHPGLPTAGLAELYVPYTTTNRLVNILVRFDGSAEVLERHVQEAVWALDAELPIPAVGTAAEALRASLALTRFYAALLGTFAVLAVLLACVGIYGVMAYSVARRAREMGIRLALGARPGQVAGSVLGEGLGVVALGLTVGLGAAAYGTRVMTTLLYEVTPTDPATYAMVAALILASAAVAAWLPARRVSRTDPAEVLRAE